MAVEAGRAPLSAPTPHVPTFRKLYGFGSIYGKTIRDSRLAFIIMAGLTGGLMLAVGAALGKDLSSPEARASLVKLVESMPPILAGLAGNPVNVGTLGGYLSWKYGPFFAIIAGLWSILALSGTLAIESQRGSLDLVAAAPFGKRRIALEKLAGHLTIMAAIAIILAISTYLVGALFASLPGDEIPLANAVNFALWVALIGLASGAVAFALSPIVGRGSAAGIAGIVMLLGFFLDSYSASVPAFGALADLTWFGWTAGNLPLAGQLDWPSLIPVATAVVVLWAVGVELFSRRDLGLLTATRWPGLPAVTLGVGGPARRSFGDRLPAALGWGIGVGVLGLFGGAGAKSLADAFAQMSPDVLQLFRTIFPNFDLGSAGGFLELMFVSFGFILVGFAAATLVAGWASDESSGRVELLLATPVSWRRWASGSGVGVLLAVVVMTLVAAAGILLGSSLVGGDIWTPTLGTAVLGLYAAALAGIGLAVGGVIGPGIAAEVVAGLVIVTFLIDLLAPALSLPDWVHQLALTAHLGQPMLGVWDPVGMTVCLVLAVGGLLAGAWGMGRRDLAA